MVRIADTSGDNFRVRVRKMLSKVLTPTKQSENTRDLGALQQNENMKDLIEIVDKCLVDQSRITTLKRVAEQSASSVSPAGKKHDDNEPWPPQYTTWGKIPAFWLWQWISGRYDEFTPRVIELLNKSEKGIVRMLIEMECGLRDTTEVDPRCHDKMVCAQLLNQLSDERGRRLKGWLAKAFHDEKQVDWNSCGSFVPSKVVDGRVTELMWAFDNQKVCVPPDIVFKEGMKIMCNYRDLGAYIGTTMGKGFLSCLLSAERKDKAEKALKAEARKASVEKITKSRGELKRAMSAHMVVVTADVQNAARKRRRTKGAPAGGPVV